MTADGDRRIPPRGEVLSGLRRIEDKVDTHAERLEDIVETIHGAAIEDIDGNKKRSGGLVAEVKRIRHDHDKRNQGIKPSDRVAIYVAGIGGMSMIVAAAVTLI